MIIGTIMAVFMLVVARHYNSKLITNYRQISVLPVISKIFETVICDQLNHYFVSKNLLCPQQYFFTKNLSTELAALAVIDRLLNQLNKQKNTN